MRSIDSLKATDHEVKGETSVSRRLLLEADDMGFSSHAAVLQARAETCMRRNNRSEPVRCVEGAAEIEDLRAGEKHILLPGAIRSLRWRDRHALRASAAEIHRRGGSYPIPRQRLNT